MVNIRRDGERDLPQAAAAEFFLRLRPERDREKANSGQHNHRAFAATLRITLRPEQSRARSGPFGCR